MAAEDFYLAVKSTLDHEMASVVYPPLHAETADLQHCDLDDNTQTSDVLGNAKPAIVWRNLSFSEDPTDPLWSWKFLVGVKTTQDAGNYDLSALLTKLSGHFILHKHDLKVRDYSGDATPTVNLGSVHIISVDTTPQQFDQQSGLRLIAINAKVIRCGV